MSRSGTLVVCLRNFQCSNSNAVMLNLIIGIRHACSIVMYAEESGDMAHRFSDCGVAVRMGRLDSLLESFTDIFLVVFSTLFTADMVPTASKYGLRSLWVVHEWCTIQEMEKLTATGVPMMNKNLIQTGCSQASHVVFCSESQRQMYADVLNGNSSGVYYLWFSP